MYYMIISGATVLFGFGFMFNKLYQKNEGSSLTATIQFSLINSAVVSVVMLFLNGMRIEFSLFSFLIALWCGTNSLLYTYCTLKALVHTNISLCSMFAMLGGMLIPFAGGTVFWHEPLTLPKLLSCAITAAALYLCVEKSKTGKKLSSNYMLVFVFNGLSGIISKIHQSAANGQRISETGFLFWANVCVFMMCAICLIFGARGKIRPAQPKKSMTYAVSYAICGGGGNLLLLISLKHLDASVQYPFVTGGTIIVSAFISLAMKERLSRRNILAIILAFISAFIVVFS